MASGREQVRRLERVLAMAAWKLAAAEQRSEEIARALAYAAGELAQIGELGMRAGAGAAPHLALLLFAAAHRRRATIAGLIGQLEDEARVAAAACASARRRTEVVQERLDRARGLERDRISERQLAEDVLRRSTMATPGQASDRMVGRAGAKAGLTRRETGFAPMPAGVSGEIE